ncbi:MAG: tetratricopeptide repeat protein [Acidobacteriota bacterium]
MRNKQKILVSLLLASFCLFFVFGNLSSQEKAEERFEKALYYEDVQGDLEKAIELYEQILKQFPESREVAAKVQLHIGLCYEKLGQTEAQRAFQKVVDNYPDQTSAVKVAKEKLARILKAKSMMEKEDKEFNIRHIWTWPDLTVFGSSSPDGRFLSFVDWSTGDLAIREIATGKQRRVTNKGVWDDEHPGYAITSRWSPDSKKLAYTWVTANNNSELRTVGIDGSEPRILVKEKEREWIDPVDWSPDGKYVLATIAKGPEKENDLVLVSAMDGTLRKIKTQKTGNRVSSGGYLFSPDGLYVAYSRSQNKGPSKHDIFLIELDSSREIPLIQNPAHDYLLGWLPDAKKLLFASNRSGSFDAWIIHVEEGKPRGIPVLVQRNIGLIRALGLTKNGSLYYSTPGSLNDIYTVFINPETGQIVTLPEKMHLTYEGSNMDCNWSPDGKELVYTSRRGQRGSQHTICIYSDETGEIRELLFDRKLVYPRWTPDGRHLFAQAIVGDGQGIYRIDVQTEEAALFIENKEKDYLYNAQISVDGKWMVYGRDNSTENFSQILYRNLKTGEEKEIDRAPFDNNSYALSPDTERLALLLRTEKDLRVLKVASSPGGTPEEIHRFSQGGRWPIAIDWSPDGQYIYFSNDPDGDGKWELWRIPSKGGEAQSLGLEMSRFGSLSVHPDGRRITFSSRPSEEELPEIWVMENFLPENENKK